MGSASSRVVQIGEERGAKAHLRLPGHCTRTLRPSEDVTSKQRMLRRRGLHSVCEEARCPNRDECWSRGHVTFMLLGDVCTRACRFCNVSTGKPAAGPDPEEPAQVARAAGLLGLSHVVLTSVNRDDLPDGGADQFAATVGAIRSQGRAMTVEVLTPDFRGDLRAIATVCGAKPDVYNHNVETVPRLYPGVRPGARFERSLSLLSAARDLLPSSVVKSGLMVGLGEEWDEVLDVFRGLRSAGVDSVTVGQYLRPSRRHLPVERYWDPQEFDALAVAGRELGFASVASGPLVRSSYRAEESYTRIAGGSEG